MLPRHLPPPRQRHWPAPATLAQRLQIPSRAARRIIVDRHDRGCRERLSSRERGSPLLKSSFPSSGAICTLLSTIPSICSPANTPFERLTVVSRRASRHHV
ncbi:uncharacterized protein K452DRAFT_17208 [Aplosporella prunicola CBS 121167]|uniref:Uncharacterized protein n=1 Tax=Aplosporella prunicola CBS 121167 TaxID=1176127 RepID=A0A6A6BGB4_9PEZI|nr:uncharacterized protein K452DRAFT_17208 [Aplosporella prunicola CBS 121167]KAF2142335.1 hypothetical protein K452DRAFT_17208 [Aplosporella prunicola CBS 121167]